MTTQSPNVALRLNELDKAALVELARRLQMNQTQTVRVLVREALAILKEQETQNLKGAFSHEATNTDA